MNCHHKLHKNLFFSLRQHLLLIFRNLRNSTKFDKPIIMQIANRIRNICNNWIVLRCIFSYEWHTATKSPNAISQWRWTLKTNFMHNNTTRLITFVNDLRMNYYGITDRYWSWLIDSGSKYMWWTQKLVKIKTVHLCLLMQIHSASWRKSRFKISNYFKQWHWCQMANLLQAAKCKLTCAWWWRPVWSEWSRIRQREWPTFLLK